MRFENRFDVDAPLEEVWATVLDVERVAPTVPGAQVLERRATTPTRSPSRSRSGRCR